MGLLESDINAFFEYSLGVVSDGLDCRIMYLLTTAYNIIDSYLISRSRDNGRVYRNDVLKMLEAELRSKFYQVLTIA